MRIRLVCAPDSRGFSGQSGIYCSFDTLRGGDSTFGGSPYFVCSGRKSETVAGSRHRPVSGRLGTCRLAADPR
jgi:hypothetical protein